MTDTSHVQRGRSGGGRRGISRSGRTRFPQRSARATDRERGGRWPFNAIVYRGVQSWAYMRASTRPLRLNVEYPRQFARLCCIFVPQGHGISPKPRSAIRTEKR
jgi:hypothetical protein